jgi:hypothetical protein
MASLSHLSQSQEASSILPVQATLTLTVHGVPPVGGPMISEFAHLRATIRTTLNGRLNPRGVRLSEVEVNDWTLHAHEAQHFEHRKEVSQEVGPRTAADAPDVPLQNRPEEAIDIDEEGDEVGLLSQQLLEVETRGRRRRRLSNTSPPAQQQRSAIGRGRAGVLSSFLRYLYDAPVTVVARHLSLTSDPGDATGDLAVTVTVTGEQTQDSLSINGKLRPEDFAYLVNRAALSSSEALANSLRLGGWLQVSYFRHAHAVNLVPRDDGGVVQYIPGDAADLDLLEMPSSVRASSSISLAGRTSAADYSSSGAVSIGLTSDSSSLGTEYEKATKTGFLLDKDSRSYLPSSYLGGVVETDSAYTNAGSATTVGPPGGGRVSVGLNVFIALACVATILLSSYFARQTIKRRKNDRATKARQAYVLPRKAYSREWRAGGTNDAATGAHVPSARHTHQQILQPPTSRATSTPSSRFPYAVALTTPPPIGVMDTRAEYSSPDPVAARRGAHLSMKTHAVSSSSGARSSTSTATGCPGKRVRFGADSVAGEDLSA